MAKAGLKRSTSDRMIAGVCGGLAAHFGIDATLVRLLWVAAVLFGGFGVLAYVILWIVLPAGDATTPAARIVEERFARGEIDAEEMRRLKEDLGR